MHRTRTEQTIQNQNSNLSFLPHVEGVFQAKFPNPNFRVTDGTFNYIGSGHRNLYTKTRVIKGYPEGRRSI